VTFLAFRTFLAAYKVPKAFEEEVEYSNFQITCKKNNIIYM
jgi:formiminotetrahydrofolate cyclodeaminase